MDDKQINQFTKAIIPELRSDLNIRLLEQNGEEVYLFQDDLGFAQQPSLIPKEIYHIISLFDGVRNSDQIFDRINISLVDTSIQIINIAYQLAEMGFLVTSEYKTYIQGLDTYLKTQIRPNVCAGSSYPKEATELSDFLKNVMSRYDSYEGSIPDAIIAPHLDFQTGDDTLEAYSKAYNSIKNSDADVFVIFGTSHYANSDFFMFTYKDYSTPLGHVETDKELLNAIAKDSDISITIDDIAHRPEHSIEFQVLMLKHIFKDHDYKILPVLTGSLHDYFGKDVDMRFNQILNAIRDTIAKQGKKVTFIAGADLAHIGRKFDDDYDAEEKLDELREYDTGLLKSIESCDAEDFFDKIANVDDKNKVCGLTPIYSLLNIVKPNSVEMLKYGQWNETETKSAVSFASLAFFVE